MAIRIRCSALLLFTIFIAAFDCLPSETPAPGVDRLLAKNRKSRISQPEYFLKAVIPRDRRKSIRGELELKFTVLKTDHDLVLDFAPGSAAIQAITLNNQKVKWQCVNEHIVIAGEFLRAGSNKLHFSFRLGDMSLNRRDDLLYTLFVPDRARTAFPCFDQPDLKGRFAVELDLPAGWDALANGPRQFVRRKVDGRRLIRFVPSHPLPTYLMAFVAGKLQRLEATREGRRVQIFHQEKDKAVLKRNIPVILEQVFASLAWMERYTGIAYPFDKYDLILVPSFQYGGMEHCGATLYRASRLLLDEDATLEERLSRTSLIAHETAHMWFGDLVTMPWFDEVWLKEVYAGFMADKMVAEIFPDIDHRLNFLMSHTPYALSVDRSQGTHPLTQRLNNLADAGTLYGKLIYDKAPIVMDQLEKWVGSDKMRLALGRYLRENAYGNAGWDPLIDLLAVNDQGLKEWSRGWVYQAGLPVITVRREGDHIVIGQKDESGRGGIWSQQMGIVVQKGKNAKQIDITLDKSSQKVALPKEYQDADLILPAGNGMGYGRILLDRQSYAGLLSDVIFPNEPLWRGAAWFALWEGVLEGHVKAASLLKTALHWMETERNTQLLEQVLRDLPALYWRLLPPESRGAQAGECASRVWQEMLRRPETLRMAFFDAYRQLDLSRQAVANLLDLLTGKQKIAGITLSEQKELDVLLNLAVYHTPVLDGLLDELPQKWKSTDRKKQLAFLRPLFSEQPQDWLAFFRNTLTKAENREQEPWVSRALALIHHPLRTEKSRELIPEMLAMLPEIQRSGDIFFPIDWLNESLWGHRSPQAAAMVRTFLEHDRTLSLALRLKVLQAADFLLRENGIPASAATPSTAPRSSATPGVTPSKTPPAPRSTS